MDSMIGFHEWIQRVNSVNGCLLVFLGCLCNWLPVLWLIVQLVACARAACVTCCLYLDCPYNWLPVVGRQDVSKTRQDVPKTRPRRLPDAPPSTGNHLHRQQKDRQPVIQAAQVQATSYTGSPSTGIQLHRQPEHRQPVILVAQAQAATYTSSPKTHR